MDDFDDERFIELTETAVSKRKLSGDRHGFEHYGNQTDDEDDTLIRMVLEAQ